ncbi:MAG: hypothetical protein EPO08_17590 [Rhodospirillaceae bacterium]|nr:MAG: hypothetical protein EPO08_17590 [Rhodospirillaceae bacterium]
MLFKKLFGRSAPERDAAEVLYRKAVEKARDPRFYREFGVADTVDGRFDMIVIYVMLLMRRLRDAQEPGRKVAQELFDIMFQDMDRSLRELGVGDLSVGKNIKKMAKAFYGRAAAYEAGLDAAMDSNEAPLIAALEQAIYRNAPGADAIAAMAGYLKCADQHLQAQDPICVAAGDVDLESDAATLSRNTNHDGR